jgi:hypothetical protein
MNDIQLRNADMEDQYVEKPRPNLYNVIRKLQESNGSYVNRIVVLSKIDEHAIKNPESNYHDWIQHIMTSDEDGDLVPQHQQGHLIWGGFAIVLGPWIIHMHEAEQQLMEIFIKKLKEKKDAKGSYIQQSHVIHYTEAVAKRAYMNWNCKTIPTSKATSEIKSYTSAQKTEYLYTKMISIGTDSLEKATAAQMGKLAEDCIPCGDELASAINEDTLPLEEWMSFVYDTPDIQLEREMQWPVERDYIY